MLEDDMAGAVRAAECLGQTKTLPGCPQTLTGERATALYLQISSAATILAGAGAPSWVWRGPLDLVSSPGGRRDCSFGDLRPADDSRG
jgi:hypothetical protein